MPKTIYAEYKRMDMHDLLCNRAQKAVRNLMDDTTCPKDQLRFSLEGLRNNIDFFLKEMVD